MFTLSLNEVPSTKPKKDIIIKDSVLRLLKEDVYKAEEKEINESFYNISKEIEACCTLLKNKSEIIKNKISTEDYGIHTEDWKEILNKIWIAIKNFFAKLGSFLMFWKKKITYYFQDRSKELKEYIDLMYKVQHKDDFDIDKFNNLKATFRFLKDDYRSSKESDFEACFRNINDLHEIFKDVRDYVNDPEQNDRDKIIMLEKSEKAISFRNTLGVMITSNENEPLAPSRIEFENVADRYEIFTTNEGRTIKLSSLIDIQDAGDITAIKTRLNILFDMTKDGLRINDIFNSIELSYKKLDRELKWKFNTKEGRDFQVDVKRTEVLVKAQDHIKKSKVLLENFINILNIESNNLMTLCEAILECHNK